MNAYSSNDSLIKRIKSYLQSNIGLRNRLFWLGGISAILTLLLIAVPIATARIATSWLVNNGASSAAIENVDINLFTGSVRLFGLEAGENAQQRFRIDQAEVDFRWWPLLSRRLHIEAIRLKDAQIDIFTDQRGNWQIGAIKISPAEESVELDSTDVDRETGFSWGIGSEIIEVSNVSFTYRDGVFDSDIEFHDVSIGSHSTWFAERTTDLVIDMSVNGSPLKLSSDVMPWAQRRSLSGNLSISDLSLDDYQPAFQNLAGLAGTTGAISLNLTNTLSLDGDGNLDIVISGPLAIRGIGFSVDELTLINEKIEWQGQVSIRLPASENQPLLHADGEIQVLGTQATLDAIAVSNRSLVWQGETSFYSPANSEQSSVQFTGTLLSEATELNLDTVRVSNDSINWQGSALVGLASATRNTQLSLDADLLVSDTAFELQALGLSTSLAALNLTTVLDFTSNGASDTAAALSVEASVTGQTLEIEHERLGFQLASLERFSADAIQVSGTERVSLQQLVLQGLHLLRMQAVSSETSPALFRLEQMNLDQLNLDVTEGLNIESLTLNEPSLLIVRNEQGEIEPISALLAEFTGDSDANTVEPVAADAEARAALPFAIGTVAIQTQNFLNFQDRSMSPPVNFRLTELNLGITNIDSESASPMLVQLTTGNDNMNFLAEGSVSAFAEELFVDVETRISSLDLPQFSAYVPGYNIDRGRLGADSSIAITGEELNMQNSLLIERLTLSGKAAGENALLAQGMAMPLDVALDLLRDNEDRIALDLPVTGSLSDPKFGSADILRTVMQNALQEAAMSYVTQALQPLGTILLVRDIATEAAKPRFAPVSMTPAESTLTPTAREYLLKLGELLTERPRLQLSICGVATEADRQALTAVALAGVPDSTEAESVVRADGQTDAAAPLSAELVAPIPPQISDTNLLQLAAQRTTAVIEFLAEETLIDRTRLFSCRETIEGAIDAEPRVMISL